MITVIIGGKPVHRSVRKMTPVNDAPGAFYIHCEVGDGVPRLPPDSLLNIAATNRSDWLLGHPQLTSPAVQALVERVKVGAR